MQLGSRRNEETVTSGRCLCADPHWTGGIIDLLTREAVYFEGEKGTIIIRKAVPEELKAQCEEYRAELMRLELWVTLKLQVAICAERVNVCQLC